MSRRLHQPASFERLRNILSNVKQRATRYKRATDDPKYLKMDLDYAAEQMDEALERLDRIEAEMRDRGAL